ncbi:STAS domain-containing protein [Catellatospora sp. KI3]|uniref:STAS domain-containing protein n=1 Tax=Catellatospora sp. KI3 TaxID=3041620 RepID=UPI002482BCF3|nr:STAS domain-containing protein [Catellatospora sp. KI3]MDI1464127.1 STAS domain-containing protein [Catellatospora sp. KI3]
MTEPLRLRLYSSPLGLYLTADGSLDASTADGLVRAVTLALHRLRPRRITIDLAEVHTIDPAGAVALACCRDHAVHAQAELGLTDPPPHLRRVLAAHVADLVPAAPSDAATGRRLPVTAWRRCPRPATASARPRRPAPARPGA